MTDRELMQMALDALENNIGYLPVASGVLRDTNNAIEALRDRLAQPEYDQTALELCDVCGWKAVVPDEGCLNCKRLAQPEREWVGLTDEERRMIAMGIEVFGLSVETVLEEAEAKLKEKNHGQS
jgi:predicted Fe-S protein YdhL (DUF1289 family)